MHCKPVKVHLPWKTVVPHLIDLKEVKLKKPPNKKQSFAPSILLKGSSGKNPISHSEKKLQNSITNHIKSNIHIFLLFFWKRQEKSGEKEGIEDQPTKW